jgi:hypothetical protein
MTFGDICAASFKKLWTSENAAQAGGDTWSEIIVVTVEVLQDNPVNATTIDFVAKLASKHWSR